ncbi:MAG: sensor histidine kinase [Opitutaceae bacterium]
MKRHQSIRWRVQMWQSLLLAVLIGAVSSLFYQNEKQTYLAEVDSLLYRAAPLLPPRISAPGGPSFGPPGSHGRTHGPRHGPPDKHREKGPPSKRESSQEVVLHFDDELSAVFGEGDLYYAIWPYSGEPLFSENAPANLQPLDESNGVGMNLIRELNGNREILGATPSLRGLLVGMSLERMDAHLTTVVWQIVGSAIGVWLGGVFVGWILTGIAVKPFEVMRRTARAIASGDLSARIPTKYNQGEVGELASDLNTSFTELEDSFEQQRRFTADASHELRSPISAMMMEAQVALKKERDAESYKESLSAINANLLKMKALTNNLLDLSRLDSGEMGIVCTTVDLGALAESALDVLHGLLEDNHSEVVLNSKSAICQADGDRITQVLVNIISNAVRHCPPRTRITLASGVESGFAWVRIQDNGPGIPIEQQPLIFERFYRGDTARKHGQGSTGLGLAISKLIVQAHGGHIELESSSGQGSCFTIHLPVERPANSNQHPENTQKS